MSFQDLGLEPALVQALHKAGYTNPTMVQRETVSKALEGKDIVARCAF